MHAALIGPRGPVLLWFNVLVYFDWVPTDDNPADWPTRADKFHLIPPEAVEVEMRLPPSLLFTPLDGNGLALAAWRATLMRVSGAAPTTAPNTQTQQQ